MTSLSFIIIRRKRKRVVRWCFTCLMVSAARVILTAGCFGVFSLVQLLSLYFVYSIHIFICPVKYFALSCNLRMANIIHACTTYNTLWRSRSGSITVFIHMSFLIIADYCKAIESIPPCLVRYVRPWFAPQRKVR